MKQTFALNSKRGNFPSGERAIRRMPGWRCALADLCLMLDGKGADIGHLQRPIRAAICRNSAPGRLFTSNDEKTVSDETRASQSARIPAIGLNWRKPAKGCGE